MLRCAVAGPLRELGAALAAGCDDFDTKPVDFARLLAKIKALLPKESMP